MDILLKWAKLMPYLNFKHAHSIQYIGWLKLAIGFPFIGPNQTNEKLEAWNFAVIIESHTGFYAADL